MTELNNQDLISKFGIKQIYELTTSSPKIFSPWKSINNGSFIKESNFGCNFRLIFNHDKSIRIGLNKNCVLNNVSNTIMISPIERIEIFLEELKFDSLKEAQDAVDNLLLIVGFKAVDGYLIYNEK